MTSNACSAACRLKRGASGLLPGGAQGRLAPWPKARGWPLRYTGHPRALPRLSRFEEAALANPKRWRFPPV